MDGFASYFFIYPELGLSYAPIIAAEREIVLFLTLTRCLIHI